MSWSQESTEQNSEICSAAHTSFLYTGQRHFWNCPPRASSPDMQNQLNSQPSVSDKADKDCCLVYINCLSGCSSWEQVFLKQKMVNKSIFGSSSYTSPSAFLLEVLNFASTNPDCIFSFHMLRLKALFFCKLPVTHSHLVTPSSCFPQKDLRVKLAASLGEESACTSGKYITLFCPSTWIRPKTHICTTWWELPWAETALLACPSIAFYAAQRSENGNTYGCLFATLCHHLKKSLETWNIFNGVCKDELNSFGWKMVLVAQMNSLLKSWGKRRSKI